MGSHESPPFHWHYADLDQTTSSVYQLRGRTLFFVVILFAIILLASLLFFYARWVCHFPSSSPSYSHNTDSPLPEVRPRRGPDAAFITALPVLLYGSLMMSPSPVKSSNAESEECCICLSLFEEDDKIKVLPDCNHCFHSDCVDRWLLTQSSCPLCRASLTFDRPQIVIH